VVNQFQQLNANLLGVVLNDINLRSSSYGYYYKHFKYQNTYENSDDPKKAGRKRQNHSKQFRKNGSTSSNQMLHIEATRNPLRKIIQSVALIFKND
jgi:Mrp family chromosome partitioning ATPase